MLHPKTARSLIALFGLVFALAASVQAEQAPAPKLANVSILATGGTIAGTVATRTTTVGSTSASVGVVALLNGEPPMTKVANASLDTSFQIATMYLTHQH